MVSEAITALTEAATRSGLATYPDGRRTIPLLSPEDAVGALTAAGLLTCPLPTREQGGRAIFNSLRGDQAPMWGGDYDPLPEDRKEAYRQAADAVMALFTEGG